MHTVGVQGTGNIEFDITDSKIEAVSGGITGTVGFNLNNARVNADNVEIRVNNGGIAAGFNMEAFSNAMVSNSTITVERNSNLTFGVNLSASTLVLNNSQISLSNNSVGQFGIRNLENGIATVNASSIIVLGTNTQTSIGIQNTNAFNIFRVNDSNIRASSRSLEASTGTGSHTSYVFTSVLNTEALGEPVCKLNFSNSGVELTDNCRFPN